jgi:Cdc6-like AAA superfamily ATPase
MITDARALRDDYVPSVLRHRNQELDSLSTALRERSQATGYRSVFISGPSGTGKTTLAKYISRQLEQESTDVRSGVVNCLSEGSNTAVLYNLLRSAELGQSVPLSSSQARLVNLLREYDGQVVAIIDEVDQLDDPSLLVTLYNLTNVSPVLICLDRARWLGTVDQRVHSRFGTTKAVQLDRYDRAAMLDILSQRVDVGLAPDSVTDAALTAIAKESGGDARRGVTLLRLCAEHAAGDGRDRITAELVDELVPEARSAVQHRYVSQLSTHPRLLYEIVAEAGEIDASTLYDRYEAETAESKTKRQRRRYLEALTDKYEVLVAQGNGPARTYRVRS